MTLFENSFYGTCDTKGQLEINSESVPTLCVQDSCLIHKFCKVPRLPIIYKVSEEKLARYSSKLQFNVAGRVHGEYSQFVRIELMNILQRQTYQV